MTTIKQLKRDPNDAFMGLEKDGYSVFPGVDSIFEIPNINGRPYIGLDVPEYADKIKRFEKYFGQNFSTPEGEEWLNNFTITINHDLNNYDERNNVEDEFKLHVLKVNNGMGLVAMSQSDIDDAPISYHKFIVSDDDRDLKTKVSKKEVKMNAYNRLQELYDSNSPRMISVAKYLHSSNSAITDRVIAFDKLDDFINKSTESAEQFLRTLKMNEEYLQTVVDIKDALYRNIIRKDGGNYVLHANGTKLGRTEEEVISFLMLDENRDLMGLGLSDDMPYSIKSQLKKSIY